MNLKTPTRTQLIALTLLGALLITGAVASTAFAQQQTQTEEEPNDVADTAQSIQTDVPVSGDISGEDRDVYSFTVPENQMVTLSFTNNVSSPIDVAFEDNDTLPVDDSTSLGAVPLEGGEQFTPLNGSEAGSRNITFDTAARGAGTFYVVVEEGSTDSDTVTDPGGSYTFTVNAGGSSDPLPTANPTTTTTTTTSTPTATETTTEATETPTTTTTQDTTTEMDEETTTEELTPEESDDSGGGKAKQPSKGDDGATDGGNGKAKMGNGGDGDDTADGGNGKAKDSSDNTDEETTTDPVTTTEESTDTETATDTNTETKTEVEDGTTTETQTDSEIDFATNASGDLNCEDFPSKELAQQNLDNNPDDPNGLDADNDGEACDAGVDA